MPPRGVSSPKRKRQYEHIKESEQKRGVGEDRAEEIAARTVNKQRAQAGETRSARGGRKKSTSSRSSSRKSSSRSSSRSGSTSRSRSSARKSGGRKRTSRKSSR